MQLCKNYGSHNVQKYDSVGIVTDCGLVAVVLFPSGPIDSLLYNVQTGSVANPAL
jgi:hypothetical protein